MVYCKTNHGSLLTSKEIKNTQTYTKKLHSNKYAQDTPLHLSGMLCSKGPRELRLFVDKLTTSGACAVRWLHTSYLVSCCAWLTCNNNNIKYTEAITENYFKMAVKWDKIWCGVGGDKNMKTLPYNLKCLLNLDWSTAISKSRLDPFWRYWVFAFINLC